MVAFHNRLSMATTGACEGHLCDNCKMCRSGTCCGRDHPDYRLPELGDWDGPVYGELGVLAGDGGQVECHCCGEWFESLVSHIRRHNLLTREYKAIFGLSMSTPLISTELSGELREKMSDILDRVRPSGSSIENMVTPEQRHMNSKKPFSIQARKRLSDANRGRRVSLQMRQHLSEVLTGRHYDVHTEPNQHPCAICGELYFVIRSRVEHSATCSNKRCKRIYWLQGHAKTHCKLTHEQAQMIRDEHSRSGRTARALAEEFNVSQSTIYGILQGKTYLQADVLTVNS